MEKNNIDGMLGGYGWEAILSRNPYMYSYTNKFNERMNFYYTTGTLTIQTPDGKMRLKRGIKTLEEYENFL